jgi:hypothetical protein
MFWNRRSAFALVGSLFVLPHALAAQQPGLDDALAVSSPFASMQMTLKKTFLKVDVLTLEVRVDPTTAARIERASTGASARVHEDSVTAAVLDAHEVWTRIVFLRGASLDQFVDEVRSSMRRAVEAGLLTQADYDRIGGMLPTWYAFLGPRRIHQGDQQIYRIDGDRLRTTYIGSDGAVLLDQLDTGAAPRRAVLSSYFAPRSDFRGKLVKSIKS